MPKGKKFNAAEKHFLKKEETLRREIKDLQEILRNTQQTLERTLAMQSRLIAENASLKQERDQLLGLQGLSSEEIRQLIKDEHCKAESFSAINTLCKIGTNLAKY